jgi:hypothetical protein
MDTLLLEADNVLYIYPIMRCTTESGTVATKSQGSYLSSSEFEDRVEIEDWP